MGHPVCRGCERSRGNPVGGRLATRPVCLSTASRPGTLSYRIDGESGGGWIMTRTARRQAESGFYHVTARGNGRQLLFHNEDDRMVFATMLKNRMDGSGISVHAWCLMDNHVHVLLQAEMGAMSSAMHRLLTGFARYFNGATGHVGHVFQGRFDSVPVETEAYLLGAVRYILLNPMRAGLSPTADYRWSSYREYSGGFCDTPAISETALVLELLGGREGFRAFVDPRPRLVAARGDFSLEDALAYHPPVGSRAPLDTLVGAACAALECTWSDLLDIKTMELPLRRERIGKLREAGLSVRQIERLTGIGRGVIEYALRPDGGAACAAGADPGASCKEATSASTR